MSRIKVLFSCVAFCAVLLSGCSDYYTPVRDFLDEYTNSAAIGSQSIAVPTERDRDGIECVASDTDGTLTFFLRNPRSYVIDPAVTFNNPGLSPAVDDYSISQSPNHQSITLTFNRSWLQSCEQAEPGTDLSGSISLTETATGRAFPSWDFTLRCNTPPPRPEGARIMLDDATGTYVLCFNLDLTNPVHKDDIAVVTINNTDYYPTTVNAGGTQEIIFGNNIDEFSPTPPPGTLTPLPDQPVFVPDTSINQVYFTSDIEHSGSIQNFTITVQDTMGLSRIASTSTAGRMLDPVTVTDMSGHAPISETLSLTADAVDGEFYYRTSHAEPGVTIHHVWNGTVRTESGDSIYTYTITESGELTVWATKPGYVPSDPVTVRIICRSNEYYVDPGTNGSDSNPGIQSAPFKTIRYAITQFNNATDPTNTIFLMDNVTALEDNSTNSGIISLSPSDNVTFTIDGSTHFAGSPLMNAYNTYATISGTDTHRSIHIGAEGDSTVTMTLKNLNIISGRTSDSGAGIYFEAADNGSSLTLDNCVVEGNFISGSGSLSGAGVYFVGERFTMRNGCRVTSNTINNSGSGSMQGAGIYISGSSPSATADIADTVIGHNSNATSSTTTGYGGGIYVTVN